MFKMLLASFYLGHKLGGFLDFTDKSKNGGSKRDEHMVSDEVLPPKTDKIIKDESSSRQTDEISNTFINNENEGILKKVVEQDSFKANSDEKENETLRRLRDLKDLDEFNELKTNYNPDTDANHPGFADQIYLKRRQEIAEVAFAYKYGDPIPYIEYTGTEIDTWKSIFKKVKELLPNYACSEYNKVFKKLEDEGVFTADRIPQTIEMNDFLYKNTGFTLRPCAGLLSPRSFLASLALRVFQSTQYVRHNTSPYHTPEPDCVHEIIGHMPLLADPSFAQFSQEIGLASLGATEIEIEQLSTLYWFTIEFGLCKENDDAVKAYGAGLLSAYGELLHAFSGEPELRPFVPHLAAIQKYQDQTYQSVYYVADSFEDVKLKFRQWVSTLPRSIKYKYNPDTKSIERYDSNDQLIVD